MNTIASTRENQISRKLRVVASAQTAALGDALGWTTELGRESTIVARTGRKTVIEPVDWVRRIGGRGGNKVDLPAGTYSDDTQLRLAVCRAIRGNGVFDAEAFARVELTSWQSYALGAGLGSKAAASNLAKRGVNWFSNFFANGKQQYAKAGGNGAAMRVQPHAWALPKQEDLILSVLRDAIITHGHPHGFVGAILHSTAVEYALKGKILNPLEFSEVFSAIAKIPEAIRRDRQLREFWLPAWENLSACKLTSAIEKITAELRSDISKISGELNTGDTNLYSVMLEKLGLKTQQYRGSGLKTALAASALAWLYRNEKPELMLVAAANELDSDTDTIATMAGAIHGAYSGQVPDWPLQDRKYITQEAERLSNVASGNLQDSFVYPDLSRWQPPGTQSDAIGQFDGRLVLMGLGEVRDFGIEYRTGKFIWQWMRLPFGQSVFVKRRETTKKLSNNQLPGNRRMAIAKQDGPVKAVEKEQLALLDDSNDQPKNTKRETEKPQHPWKSLDEITDDVIRSGFDPLLIGQAFNYLVENNRPIEDIVAYSAIIAKARRSRLRRSGNIR